MIKAGTVWKCGGQTVEWQREMPHGAPITCESMLIDGKHPMPDDPLPYWAFWPDGIMRSKPPDGVRVIQPPTMG